MALYKRSQLAVETFRNVMMGPKHVKRNPILTPTLSSEPPLQLKMRYSFLSSKCAPYLSASKPYKFPNSKPKVSSKWKLLALLVCSGITIYWCHLETIPYTYRTHFVFMTAKREKLLSEMRFRKLKQIMLEEKVLCVSDPETQRVKSIAKDLITALYKEISDAHQPKRETKQVHIRHLEALHWEVVVFEYSEPLAKSMPGGKIIVCTGLSSLLQTDAEIAAVIAHQIGHVVGRHLNERMSKDIWKTIFKRMLCCIVTPDAVNKMPFFNVQDSSAEMEMEANYIGLMLMASAGYDPSAAKSAYDKVGRRTSKWKRKPCIMRSELNSQTHVMEKATKLYKAKISDR